MKKWIIRIVLILILLESLIVSAGIALRITDTGGFESIFDWFNLVILVFLIGVVFVSAWVLIRILPAFAELIWINRIETNPRLFWGMLAFFVLVLIEAVQDLLFLQANLPETYYPILLRENQSLLIWAALASTQCIVGLILIGWNKHIKLPKLSKIHIWIVLGVLAGFVFLLSGKEGSLKTNSPLPFLHILLVTLIVFGCGVLINLLVGKRPRIASILSSDLLAFVILWVLAFSLWANVDLEPNGFIDIQRPPNYQYSPTSDAIFYEVQAQRFLIGEGFDEAAQHSFYGYLLSGLHAIGGDHYLDIYRLQIVLLAIVPFFLYKLTDQLGYRFSGWMLAGLYIIREYNALILGDTITVSNVQVLMTEPMATLGVVLFIYLTVTWLQNRDSNQGFLVLIGAVLGLVVLIRVELLSLVIIFGLTSLLVYRKEWKRWITTLVFVGVALSLIIVPWVIRNYQMTGVVTIDKGDVLEKSFPFLSSRSSSGSEDEAGEISQLERALFPYIRNKSRSIWYRFSTSLGQSVLYLPSNHLPLVGIDHFIKIAPEKGKVFFFQDGIFSNTYLTSYAKSLPYWDARWDGMVTQRSYFPVFVVLVTVSLGVWFAWKQHSWIGLFPLLVFGTHILIYAFFGASGGRYIQVVDWTTAFYLCLGINMMIMSFTDGRAFKDSFGKYLLLSRADKTSSINYQRSVTRHWKGIVWAILLIIIGISMPVTEFLIPRRYTSEILDNRFKEIVNLDSTAQDQDLLVTMQSIQLTRHTRVYGKALYPGFFAVDETFTDDRQGYLPPAGQSRLMFYVIGTKNIWVSIPMDEPPDYFPHGAEVVLLGDIVRDSEEDLKQRKRPYFLASEVYLLEEGNDSKLDILQIE